MKPSASSVEVEAGHSQIIPPGEIATVIDNMGIPNSGINLSLSDGTPMSSATDGEIIDLPEVQGHGPTPRLSSAPAQGARGAIPRLVFFFAPSDIVTQVLNFGLSAPIDIQVAGRNIEGNRKFALNLLERLRQVTGIADLRMQQPFDQPKLDVEVDRVKAQQAGFSQREVASNLLITLSGSFQTNPTFWLNPKNSRGKLQRHNAGASVRIGLSPGSGEHSADQSGRSEIRDPR